MRRMTLILIKDNVYIITKEWYMFFFPNKYYYYGPRLRSEIYELTWLNKKKNMALYQYKGKVDYDES